jgi:hypothetical protein
MTRPRATICISVSLDRAVRRAISARPMSALRRRLRQLGIRTPTSSPGRQATEPGSADPVRLVSDVQVPSEAKAPENARDLDRARAGWAWRTSS